MRRKLQGWWVTLHQHSPCGTLFHLFFFSFKGPHIYLSMLSRHLKISKPIWHYLHHGQPLKFASVEWLWQAITPMQDIGNLTRICSDKSGRSKGGAPPPEGGEGGRKRGCSESGLQYYSRKRSESQIHANIQQTCQNIQWAGGRGLSDMTIAPRPITRQTHALP